MYEFLFDVFQSLISFLNFLNCFQWIVFSEFSFEFHTIRFVIEFIEFGSMRVHAFVYVSLISICYSRTVTLMAYEALGDEHSTQLYSFVKKNDFLLMFLALIFIWSSTDDCFWPYTINWLLHIHTHARSMTQTYSNSVWISIFVLFTVSLVCFHPLRWHFTRTSHSSDQLVPNTKQLCFWYYLFCFTLICFSSIHDFVFVWVYLYVIPVSTINSFRHSDRWHTQFAYTKDELIV